MKTRYPDLSKKNITHSRIHYLWAIDELSKTSNSVRAIDIAKFLGVSRSAVCVALSHLKKQNLVIEKQPSHILELTYAGKETIRKVDTKYSILVKFFKNYLNLDEEIAKRQACLIEHLLMDEVSKRLSQLLKETKSK